MDLYGDDIRIGYESRADPSGYAALYRLPVAFRQRNNRWFAKTEMVSAAVTVLGAGLELTAHISIITGEQGVRPQKNWGIKVYIFMETSSATL